VPLETSENSNFKTCTPVGLRFFFFFLLHFKTDAETSELRTDGPSFPATTADATQDSSQRRSSIVFITTLKLVLGGAEESPSLEICDVLVVSMVFDVVVFVVLAAAAAPIVVTPVAPTDVGQAVAVGIRRLRDHLGDASLLSHRLL
jgi:hypothetical protein